MHRAARNAASRTIRLTWSLAFAAALGCGPAANTGAVDGVISIDGKPMGGFEVSFTSTADGVTARGYAKQNGEFELFIGRGRRQIPVGQYKVTVTPSPFVEGVPEPKVKLPSTYSNVESTPLLQDIEAGENHLAIDVVTK